MQIPILHKGILVGNAGMLHLVKLESYKNFESRTSKKSLKHMAHSSPRTRATNYANTHSSLMNFSRKGGYVAPCQNWNYTRILNL